MRSPLPCDSNASSIGSAIHEHPPQLGGHVIDPIEDPFNRSEFYDEINKHLSLDQVSGFIPDVK